MGLHNSTTLWSSSTYSTYNQVVLNFMIWYRYQCCKCSREASKKLSYNLKIFLKIIIHCNCLNLLFINATLVNKKKNSKTTEINITLLSYSCIMLSILSLKFSAKIRRPVIVSWDYLFPYIYICMNVSHVVNR